jgi:hypothetical protein
MVLHISIRYHNNADHSQHHSSSKPRVVTSSVLRCVALRWHGHMALATVQPMCMLLLLLLHIRNTNCTLISQLTAVQIAQTKKAPAAFHSIQLSSVHRIGTISYKRLTCNPNLHCIAYGPNGQLRFTISRRREFVHIVPNESQFEH